jgi:2-oxoglutarate ferredoxin oxidoreductase subunit alpha
VFVLVDKELALTMRTVDAGGFEDVAVQKRQIVDPADTNPPTEYSYEPPSDVVPMQVYGGEHPVRFTGSTHDEQAFITKNPAVVGALNEHLIRKITDHADEITLLESDPEDGARTLLVSYGVTAGSMRDAVATARASGTRVASLTVQSLWPVPEAGIRAVAAGVERVVVAELNPGLYTREIERVLPDVELLSVARTDGRLISPSELVEQIK